MNTNNVATETNNATDIKKCIDDAIKAARDLYEESAAPWPVAIWTWPFGGYGFGHDIPEQVDAILYIDGTLIAFNDMRRAS